MQIRGLNISNMSTYLGLEFIVKEPWKAIYGWLLLQKSVAIHGNNPPKNHKRSSTEDRVGKLLNTDWIVPYLTNMTTYLCLELIVNEPWEALYGWLSLQNSVVILDNNQSKNH
jgi:hypothetical protein